MLDTDEIGSFTLLMWQAVTVMVFCPFAFLLLYNYKLQLHIFSHRHGLNNDQNLCDTDFDHVPWFPPCHTPIWSADNMHAV